jgi:hypothetical protein
MHFKQKIVAFFFAALITYIGVTHPVVPSYVTLENTTGESTIFWIEKLPDANYFLQESIPSSAVPGWKTEFKIPGLFFRNLNFTFAQQRLPGFKKIFFQDVSYFSPCKSLLLFPYHDFL